MIHGIFSFIEGLFPTFTSWAKLAAAGMIELLCILGKTLLFAPARKLIATAGGGFPLLGKELTEQSARPRTYHLRVVFAALLYGVAFLVIFQRVPLNAGGLAILGQGGPLFEGLVVAQFVGIYLLMPAISCGVISNEKERDTFSLLLLTKLNPTTILLEKWLSRVIAMSSFLLISLPLFAFAYSLGGISEEMIRQTVTLLGLTILQVGALSLAASAFCRTTAAAFILSYLAMIVIALEFCPLPGCSGLLGFWRLHDPELLRTFADPVLASPQSYTPFSIIFSMLIFLLIARASVVQRAFVRPRNYLLEVFRAFDVFFKEANDVLAGGIVLIKDVDSLPNTEPVAWRETTKRALGTARYLFRVLLALELPVLLISFSSTTQGYRGNVLNAGVVAQFVIWVIAALLIAVKGAALFTAERSQQTLDVLLVTPMPTRTIILEKFRGIRRLIFVMMIPIVNTMVFHGNNQLFFNRRDNPFADVGGMGYALIGLGEVVILPTFVAWLSILIGLRCRKPTIAVLATLSTLLILCSLPLAVMVLHQLPAGELLSLLSPAGLILAHEFQSHQYYELSTAIRHGGILGFYSVLTFFLRDCCLRYGSRFLERAEPASSPRAVAPVTELEFVS